MASSPLKLPHNAKIQHISIDRFKTCVKLNAGCPTGDNIHDTKEEARKEGRKEKITSEESSEKGYKKSAC